MCIAYNSLMLYQPQNILNAGYEVKGIIVVVGKDMNDLLNP
jgi:hypothetical protein